MSFLSEGLQSHPAIASPPGGGGVYRAILIFPEPAHISVEFVIEYFSVTQFGVPSGTLQLTNSSL